MVKKGEERVKEMTCVGVVVEKESKETDAMARSLPNDSKNVSDT